MAEEIRDDEVGADSGEALAFPLVDGAALGLGRRYAYGDSAHFLDVFDFDVAVAESEELVAAALGPGDQAANQNLFGKTFVVIERTEDTAREIAVDIQEAGFLPHVDLIRAAGQEHTQAARVKRFEQLTRAGNQIFF